MKLEDLNGREYMIEHVDARPLYVAIPAGLYSAPSSIDSRIPHYEYLFGYNVGDVVDYFTQYTDIDRIAKAVIALERDEDGLLRELYHTWRMRFDSILLPHYRATAKRGVSALSDDELIAVFERQLETYERAVGYPAFLDAYMFYADREFHRLLSIFKEERKVEEDVSYLFSTLSAPVDESFLSECERDLSRIAKKKSEGKDVDKDISGHTDRYAFVRNSYVGPRSYGRDEIIPRIEEIIETGSYTESDPSTAHRNDKAKLLQKYDFGEEILILVRLTELFVKWQDDRKMWTLTRIQIDSKIVEEVARRRGLQSIAVEYCSYEDIPKIVKGDFDLERMEQRVKEPFLRVFQNGLVAHEVIGAEATKIFAANAGKHDESVTKVRGFTACLGNATGKVRIVRKFSDAAAFERGEILVISMTRPEHTTIMQKSAAIVTDDGGITSHAAIVAREMKKPCIIGTKIATRVFKDGDMVEVDANKGIVRKL